MTELSEKIAVELAGDFKSPFNHTDEPHTKIPPEHSNYSGDIGAAFGSVLIANALTSKQNIFYVIVLLRHKRELLLW